MTVILGLKCRDALIVATDSRTTDNEEVRDDTEKVIILPMKNAGVIIASSGNAETSAVILETLKREAANQELTDYQSVSDLMDRAILSYKRKLCSDVHGCKMPKLNSI